MKKAEFEWDSKKNQLNIKKHAVYFYDAQQAFMDERRIIADLDHSRGEKRYFCFGKVFGRVMTVRFTWRNNIIWIIGAGYWRKGKKYMMKSKRKKSSNEPIGRVKVVKDFLPPPEKLLIRPKPVKVTITLSKDSVDFFKQIAHKEHVPYQKLIRALLDQYASQYR